MRLGCLLLTLCAMAVAQETWSAQHVVSLEYPPLAQQAKIQGSVEVVCSIGPTGEVLDCTGKSGNPMLQSAAIENAKRWRFQHSATPSENGGQIQLRYEFVLQGAPVRRRPKVEFSFDYPNREK